MMVNPHATFEHIVRACRMAEIHEMIESLPKAYQTAPGERGVAEAKVVHRALLEFVDRTGEK